MILLIMIFVVKFFLTIAFYQLLKQYWIFINYGLFFLGKNSTVSNLENNFKNFKYSYSN